MTARCDTKLNTEAFSGGGVTDRNDESDTARKELPGGSREACVRRFEDDPDVDDPNALCGWLETQLEEGNDAVKEWDGENIDDLVDALQDPAAQRVFEELTVTYVSGVSDPAQDSQWIMAKSADHEVDDGADPISTGEIVVKDDDADEQKAWAPVLIPNETDKDGDVVPAGVIEDAAHDFLADYRQIDTDHDLIDGKGKPIESWILKETQTFDLPNGGESREYPAGTWMMGVEFESKAWERVKSGELTGFSIYGMADKTPVDDVLGLSKEAEVTNKMTDDTPSDGGDSDGADLEETVKSLNDTVESLNESVEATQKRIDALEDKLEEVEQKATSDDDADDVDVDELEEKAADAAEDAAEAAIKSALDLDDDTDLEEAREVIRKAHVDPDADGADDEVGSVEITADDLKEVL